MKLETDYTRKVAETLRQREIEKLRASGFARKKQRQLVRKDKTLQSSIKRKMYARKKKIQMINATPFWVVKKEINAIYAEARALTLETGIKMEVDHIVPIMNPNVCGLHCVENLQIITMDENRAKHNSFVI